MTTHCNPRPEPRWSREQIRAARLAPLVPLLQERGLALAAREAGNFILPAYPGLVVKDSYWRWPERDLAGNAIDFHVQVSAYPSTTPCTKSPALKSTAGVVTLRRQCGQNPGKIRKTGFTTAVWKSAGPTVAYDANVAKTSEAVRRSKMTSRVTTVRPERGYLATNYDASPARLPKTLRCQFGQKYDANKVRNTYFEDRAFFKRLGIHRREAGLTPSR